MKLRCQAVEYCESLILNSVLYGSKKDSREKAQTACYEIFHFNIFLDSFLGFFSGFFPFLITQIFNN